MFFQVPQSVMSLTATFIMSIIDKLSEPDLVRQALQ